MPLPQRVVPLASLTEAADVGARGKKFDLKLQQAFDLLGLNYAKQTRGDGPVWDVHPTGAGWHALIKDRDVNIKIRDTSWLFSSRPVYDAMMAAYHQFKDGVLSRGQADARVVRAVDALLREKSVPNTAFMKPKDKAIVDAVFDAVDKRDVAALRKLLVARNFTSKRLGRSYKVIVKIDWTAKNCEDDPGCVNADRDATRRAGTWQHTAQLRILGGVNGTPFNMVTEMKWTMKSSGPRASVVFTDASSLVGKPHHVHDMKDIGKLKEALSRRPDDYKYAPVGSGTDAAVWDAPSSAQEYEPDSKPSAQVKKLVADCNKALSDLDAFGVVLDATSSSALFSDTRKQLNAWGKLSRDVKKALRSADVYTAGLPKWLSTPSTALSDAGAQAVKVMWHANVVTKTKSVLPSLDFIEEAFRDLGAVSGNDFKAVAYSTLYESMAAYVPAIAKVLAFVCEFAPRISRVEKEEKLHQGARAVIDTKERLPAAAVVKAGGEKLAKDKYYRNEWGALAWAKKNIKRAKSSELPRSAQDYIKSANEVLVRLHAAEEAALDVYRFVHGSEHRSAVSDRGDAPERYFDTLRKLIKLTRTMATKVKALDPYMGNVMSNYKWNSEFPTSAERESALERLVGAAKRVTSLEGASHKYKRMMDDADPDASGNFGVTAGHPEQADVALQDKWRFNVMTLTDNLLRGGPHTSLGDKHIPRAIEAIELSVQILPYLFPAATLAAKASTPLRQEIKQLGPWRIVLEVPGDMRSAVQNALGTDKDPVEPRRLGRFVRMAELAYQLYRKAGVGDRTLKGDIVLKVRKSGSKEGFAGFYTYTGSGANELIIYADMVGLWGTGDVGVEDGTWTLVHELAHRVYYRGLTSNARNYWNALILAMGKPLSAPVKREVVMDVAARRKTASGEVTIPKSWLTGGHTTPEDDSIASTFGLWFNDQYPRASWDYLFKWLDSKKYTDHLPTNYANSTPREAWPEVIAAMLLRRKRTSDGHQVSDQIQATVRKLLRQTSESLLAEGDDANVRYKLVTRMGVIDAQAYAGGGLIGRVQAWETLRTWEVGKAAVAQAFQRRGIATKLYQMVSDEACRRGKPLGSKGYQRSPAATHVWQKVGKLKSGDARHGDYEIPCESIEEADYTNTSGEDFWGNAGAGILPIAKSTGRILVGLRSRHVNEPGTWGVFGGAINDKENPKSAAMREMREELGCCRDTKLIPAYVFTSKGGGFKFSNFIGLVDEEFKPKLDWETERAEWMTFEELRRLPKKHFGLEALLKNSVSLIKRHTISESLDEKTYFHGTDADAFTAFDASKFGSTDSGFLGRGVYVSTDPAIARNKRTMLRVDLSFKRPLRVNADSWDKRDKPNWVNDALGTKGLRGTELTKELVKQGYDAVVLDYTPMGYRHQEVMVPRVSQARIIEARDYKKEYKEFHAKPEQRKNRSTRNKARRKLGLKNGDKREVDHKKPLSRGGGNGDGNLRAVSRTTNRAKAAKSESLQSVMMPITALQPSPIDERSFTEKDIPPEFYVVTNVSTRHSPGGKGEATWKELGDGVLDGVRGIGGTGEIELHYLDSSGDISIVMPGKETIKLNSLTRVMYWNPHYLMANNLEALKRVVDTRTTQSAVERFGRNFEEVVTKRSHGSLDFGNNLRRYADNEMKGQLKINTVYDFIRYAKRVAEWMTTIDYNGRPERDWRDKLNSWSDGQWADAMSRAAQLVYAAYESESEWIVKNKKLRLPKGTKLRILFGGVIPPSDKLAAWREWRALPDAERRADPRAQDMLRMEGTYSMQDYAFMEDRIVEYGLRSRYDIEFVNAAKMEKDKIAGLSPMSARYAARRKAALGEAVSNETQWAESVEIKERSFSSSDIPKEFRVAFDLAPWDADDKKHWISHNNEETWRELARMQFKGLRGISDTGNIEIAYLGTARNAVLVMPGKAVVQTNKLTRVMYDNPHYLISNNMAALRRIYNKKEEHETEQLMNMLFSDVTDAWAATATGSDTNTLWRIVKHQDWLAEIARQFKGPVRDIKMLVRRVREAVERWKAVKSWGNKQQFYDIITAWPDAELGKWLLRGLRIAGSSYQNEGEWIIKNDVFKVPKGSTLKLLLDADDKRESFERRFAGGHKSIPKLYKIEYIEASACRSDRDARSAALGRQCWDRKQQLVKSFGEAISNETQWAESVEHIEERRVVRTRMPRKVGSEPSGRYDWETEEGFNEGDRLTVYHGFSYWKGALVASQRGLSGKDRAARRYSYENDNNPRGLFVSLDAKTAREFSGGSGIQAFIEFDCKYSELEAPVWPGGGFVSQGHYAPEFGGDRENKREAARLARRAKAKASDIKTIASSSRPELAATLLGTEWQALFVGDLNPQRVRAVWVRDSYRDPFRRMKRQAFVKGYGGKLSQDDLRNAGFEGSEYSQRAQIGFKPQDPWNVEEFKRRFAKRARISVGEVEHEISDPPWMLQHVSSMLWPKQLPGFVEWAKKRFGFDVKLRESVVAESVVRTAYHASSKVFDQGHTLDVGHEKRSEDYGIFVTPKRKQARMWGNNVHTVRVAMRNPLVVSWKGDIPERIGSDIRMPGGLITKPLARAIEAAGYDSVIWTDDGKSIDKANEFILFDRRQVTVLGLEEAIYPDHRLKDGAPIKTGGWLKLKQVNVPLAGLARVDEDLQEHAAFCVWANTLNESMTDEGIMDMLRGAGKAIQARVAFLSDLAKATKFRLSDLVTMFKDSRVYRIFAAVGWSMKRLHQLIKSGFGAYRAVLDAIAEFVANTKVGKWTEEKLRALDAWLKNHPKLARLGGVAVAGLLVYMWFTMTFTGDLSYDFGMDDVLHALTGNFSLAKLFGGRDGMKLLILFASGALTGMSFPWPGSPNSLFILGIVQTIAKKVRAHLRTSRDPANEATASPATKRAAKVVKITKKAAEKEGKAKDSYDQKIANIRKAANDAKIAAVIGEASTFRQGKACPMPGYGGLPTGGRLGSSTEYEIGARRFFEAAHCLLGSIARTGEGDLAWERAHILEELGIMEYVLKEYGKTLYSRAMSGPDYSTVDDYDKEGRTYAQMTMDSLAKHAPKLISRAKELLTKINSWFGKDYAQRALVSKLTYQSVIALAEALLVNVREWKKRGNIVNAYRDAKTNRAVSKLRAEVNKLLPKLPPQKPEKTKNADRSGYKAPPFKSSGDPMTDISRILGFGESIDESCCGEGDDLTAHMLRHKHEDLEET